MGSSGKIFLGQRAMAVTPKRKRLILATWNDRGKSTWDPETHGKGVPLHIKVLDSMGPRSSAHKPLTLPDSLEFRLESRMVCGSPVAAVVCEGVVVEMLTPARRL
jgi:hypothetical protein